MPNDRLERWKVGGKNLGQVDTWLAFITQHLGQLDCQLINLDNNVNSGRWQLEEGGSSYDMSATLGLSYFWVLGAYELVRVIDERARNRDPFCSTNFPNINTLKKEFTRLRIPLAKLKPASKYETDFGFAVPRFDTVAKSVAWMVADNVVLTRRTLADKLLDLLSPAAK